MSEILDAVVVGAGYAGLGVSYFLKKHGVDHLVFERSRIGETWRTQRWGSFKLNTPNARSMLPGDTFEGSDPWGAQTHHEFVTYLEDYSQKHSLPVEFSAVSHLAHRDDGHYRLETGRGAVAARNVVVATGNLNVPTRPGWSVNLPPELLQIDSSHYRDAESLPEGAVLVVGSGQSGGQIAEDLALAGRDVYLATSRLGRLPRRYRGGDTFDWLTRSGFLDTPSKELLRADGKRPVRALLGATHTLSLQSLSALGVILLGRLQGYDAGRFMMGDDLAENISFADQASVNIKGFLDAYIERSGLNSPQAEDDPAETIPAKLPDPPIRALYWTDSGIGAVIWCTGFAGDFRWIDIPGVLDDKGEPVHQDGASTKPGLCFAGLDFGLTRKSGTIPAIAEEAAPLVERLLARLKL
jgi:putative flavoprotein involved in K+ transport